MSKYDLVLDAKIPAGPLKHKWDRHRAELKLVSPNNKRKRRIIVVGTGLAGASAATSLAEQGYRVEAFTFHDSPRRAHSIAAQGGINAAKNYQNDGDSIWRLFYDTIKGGDFRSREANVYRLAQVSTNIIDQRVSQGVPFAREYGGQLANRSFGGAQVSRTFYCRGQTGQQLLLGAYSALSRQIASGQVRLHTRSEMLDLIVVNGRTRGTPMRIYPAPHYSMGGLWVDYNLMSNLAGLFIIGEANFSDHGANRLGASALMQGLADGYFILPYTIGDYLASYSASDLMPEMSVLEMLDKVNEELVESGELPIAFDHDCREGICGSCSMVINGRPHGPETASTTCQTFLRSFSDGSTLYLEPFRAAAFPVIRDLTVDRSALDRIIQAGGYVSANVGGAPDGNAVAIPQHTAEAAMDAAACIGCGACVAACKNASAMLFTAAKVSHLATLQQGDVERSDRVRNMILQMDEEQFGSCTNQGACSAVCPKEISLDWIAKLNREHLRSKLSLGN